MKTPNVVKNLTRQARKFFSVCLALLTLTLGWAGFGYNATPAARALNINPSLTLAESNPVADKINEVFGAGTTDKAAGKAQQDLGTAQRKTSDRLSDKIEGAGKEVQGRAQYDVGRVKDKVERDINEVDRQAGNAAENIGKATDSLVDSVKDIFGQ